MWFVKNLTGNNANKLVKDQKGDISPLAMFLCFTLVIFIGFVIKGISAPDTMHDRHYALVRSAAVAASMQTKVDGYGVTCIDPYDAKKSFTEYLMLNFAAYPNKVKSWEILKDKSGTDIFYVFDQFGCVINKYYPPPPDLKQVPNVFYIPNMNALQFINGKDEKGRPTNSVLATVRVHYTDNHFMDYSVVQSEGSTPWQ